MSTGLLGELIPRWTEWHPGKMFRKSSCLDVMTWDGGRVPRDLFSCSPLLIKYPPPASQRQLHLKGCATHFHSVSGHGAPSARIHSSFPQT